MKNLTRWILFYPVFILFCFVCWYILHRYGEWISNFNIPLWVHFVLLSPFHIVVLIILAHIPVLVAARISPNPIIAGQIIMITVIIGLLYSLTQEHGMDFHNFQTMINISFSLFTLLACRKKTMFSLMINSR